VPGKLDKLLKKILVREDSITVSLSNMRYLGGNEDETHELKRNMDTLACLESAKLLDF
jgi:hypothetical protein